MFAIPIWYDCRMQSLKFYSIISLNSWDLSKLMLQLWKFVSLYLSFWITQIQRKGCWYFLKNTITDTLIRILMWFFNRVETWIKIVCRIIQCIFRIMQCLLSFFLLSQKTEQGEKSLKIQQLNRIIFKGRKKIYIDINIIKLVVNVNFLQRVSKYLKTSVYTIVVYMC